jgi:hypothetical protein
MGDDIPGSRPDMAQPDVGGSITFDSEGNVRGVGVDVPIPGLGGAHLEWSPDDHDPAPTGPGWMPNFSDPNEPAYNPLPPHPGWHRDPVTGIEYPDLNVPAAGSDSFSEPGDYPLPDPDEPIV